jgi:hypothetical protein
MHLIFFHLNLISIQLKGIKNRLERPHENHYMAIELIYFIDVVKSNFFFVATFHHVATKKCFANDIKDFEMHDLKKSP